MPFNIFGANSVSGYTVKNSLRFNSGSSDYLNRTPASAGNRRTFTLSTWVKRSKLGITTQLFGASTTAPDELGFNTSDQLRLYIYNNASSTIRVSTQLFRDVSAWYHVVIAFDTPNATAQNRCRVYINGTEITSWTTNNTITQNLDVSFNNNIINYIGRDSSGEYFDGYMAETYLIDGQQLDPSSFGETDTDTGIWKPKAYTGTYGTNGFYLKLGSSSALGTDSSGNGNNFTVNNLTSIDQTTDTPTNNFCTLNPLFPQNDNLTFTNGNLQATKPSGTATGSYFANFGVSAGKWYWEMKCNATGGADQWIGVGQMRTLTPSGYAGNDAYCIAAGHTNSALRYNGTNVGTYTMASWTAGDIISIALDMDNSKVYWGKNGTWQNSGNPATGTGAYTNSTIFDGNFIFPVGSLYQSSGDVAYNFGNPIASANSYQDANGRGNFSYSVPSGYYSLCTANLSLYG